MDKLSTTKLKRDPDKINKLFKNVGDSIVCQDSFRVVFPKRYEDKELAIMGSTVKVVSIYAILDDEGNYSVANAPIYQDISPYNIKNATVSDGSVNTVLYFEKGQVFMDNRNLVKIDDFMFDLFDEFFIRGNVPWFIEYGDLSNIFLETKRFADSNIGKNPITMEILASIITRSKDNKRIYFRQVLESKRDKKNPYEYIGLNNIYYSFDNTGSKLVGSYFNQGLDSALLNKETESSELTKILRS